MRPHLLLMMLLAGPVCETTNAVAAAPMTACDEVAAHVQAVLADPRVLQRPAGQDYDDYDTVLAPVIRFPEPELANADLWAKAKPFFAGEFGDQVYEVQHVTGPVWRAVLVAGTAECQTEHFFSVDRNGELRAIATPAVFGDLCWSSSRRIGSVNGRTALIEQEIRTHPLLGVDIEITPWTSALPTACQVAVRFNDAFRVTERFCKDPTVCAAAEPLAPKLAEALARADDGTTLATVAPPSSQQAQAMAVSIAKAKERFEGIEFGYTDIPTFGAAIKTKYPTYSGSPHVALIAVAGRTLIARIGLGGIGWRELGDYLITLYSGVGEDLDPVASFVVERKNVGLRSVTTGVPKPQVNKH